MLYRSSPSEQPDDIKASQSVLADARGFLVAEERTSRERTSTIRANGEKRAVSFLVNSLTRVNSGHRAPPILPGVLRSPTLYDSSRGIRSSIGILVPLVAYPPSHVPPGSYLVGSILLHSRRGLSPKDERLYKRDVRCLKHVRRNRTGASRTGRVTAASRAHLFPFVSISVSSRLLHHVHATVPESGKGRSPRGTQRAKLVRVRPGTEGAPRRSVYEGTKGVSIMRPARNSVPLATMLAATALLLRPIHADGKRKKGNVENNRNVTIKVVSRCLYINIQYYFIRKRESILHRQFRAEQILFLHNFCNNFCNIKR